MERIRIFDGKGNSIGTATREEAHRKGLWHETFSCWFICFKGDACYILLQHRSDNKENYPGLLDITAAGHLMENEKVSDGVREVKEELGIEIKFDELFSVGVIPSTIITEKVIDRELVHTYLYNCEIPLEDFILQEEEVSGIVKGRFSDFEALWLDKQMEMKVEGISYTNGNRRPLSKLVSKADFVQNELHYYKEVILGIRKYIANRKNL